MRTIIKLICAYFLVSMVAARRGGSRSRSRSRSSGRANGSRSYYSSGYSRGRTYTYASGGSNYGRQSDVDLETEISQWWTKTQDVVGNMLSTWSKRHGEEYAYWQGGGVLDNSSFVQAIKNGSEEIKDTIVYTLNQTMPMMKDLSMLIEEQKASDKNATKAYVHSMMTDQRRQNISDVMENITAGIKQGYRTLERELSNTKLKVDLAQRKMRKQVYNRMNQRGIERSKQSDTLWPMYALSKSADEGMTIVRGNFRKVQRKVERAARTIEDVPRDVSIWVEQQAREAQRAASRP